MAGRRCSPGMILSRLFTRGAVIACVLIAVAGGDGLNGRAEYCVGLPACLCYQSGEAVPGEEGGEHQNTVPGQKTLPETLGDAQLKVTTPQPLEGPGSVPRDLWMTCNNTSTDPTPFLCTRRGLRSLTLSLRSGCLPAYSLACLGDLTTLTLHGGGSLAGGIGNTGEDSPQESVVPGGEMTEGNCSLSLNGSSETLIGIARELSGLEKLVLTGLPLDSVPWEALSALENLTHLSLTDSSLADQRLTVSMSQLESLHMSHTNLASLQANSLYDLWSIRVLNFSHNAIDTIDPQTFDPVRGNITSNESTSEFLHVAWFNLDTLDLSYNNLTSVDAALFRSPIRNVRKLLLCYNQLTQLPRYSVEDLHNLQRLELQHNEIYWLDVGLFTNNQLRYLDLSHNKLKKIISMTFLYLPSVEKIDLSHNELNFIYKYAFYRTCKKHRHVTVDASYNHLQTDVLWTLLSSFQHVLKGGQCPVDIDLTNNRMTHIIGEAVTTLDKYLQEEDFNYFRIWELVRFNITSNPLMCDCEVYNELQVFRNMIDTFPERLVTGGPAEFWRELTCRDPEQERGVPVEEAVREMRCPVTTQCPKSCRCVTEPSRGVIHVDCSYQRLRAFPTSLPTGPKELHLAGNHISYIPHKANLDNVTLIDLSHNQMTSLRPDIWEVFARIPVVFLHRNRIKTLPHDLKFDTNVKQVTLHGNPFRCTCTEMSLREILRNNTDVISDVEKVKCNTGEAILELDNTFFECSRALLKPPVTSNFNIATFTFATILAIGFIVGTMLFLLRHKIGLLFHKNLGGYKVHADTESFKRFDSFVLFSDFDSGYISDSFLPQIQDRAPYYRLCVPQRDWRPSASVSDNMINSADSSKCTIVILSNNFLDTNLTSPEYYSALVSVLQNPCYRTCFVCLEDVTLGARYPLLQAALQKHRMFRADDILFWETLFHFIPSGGRKDALLHQDEEYLFDQDEMSLEFEKY